MIRNQMSLVKLSLVGHLLRRVALSHSENCRPSVAREMSKIMVKIMKWQVTRSNKSNLREPL